MTKPTTRSDSNRESILEGDQDQFEQMRQEMETMKAEAEQNQALADKRHAELMELLLKLTPPSNPPPPPVNTTTPALSSQPPPTSTSQQPPVPPPTRPPPSFFKSEVTIQHVPLCQTQPMMQLVSPMMAPIQQYRAPLPLPMRDGRYQYPSYTAEPFLEDQGDTPVSVAFAEGGSSGNGRIHQPTRDTGWGAEHYDHRNHRGGQVSQRFPTGTQGYGGGRIPEADYRLRRLKMPLFEGEDAFRWIYKVERFFEVQGLNTFGEKLRAAVLCLEGSVLAWYRWNEERSPFCTWEELKLQLLERFQPSQEGNLHEQFLCLTQMGTAREYVGAFESLAAQLRGIPEQIVESNFIKGLKPDLHNDVQLLQPRGLRQTIKLTLMIDESRTGTSNVSERTATKAVTYRSQPTGAKVTWPAGGEEHKGYTPAPRAPFKRMTETELAEKRAKGLCSKCDGKFGPGHKCPGKAMQVLLVEGDDIEEDLEDTEHVHLDMVSVLASSVMGITTPHTMKLRRRISGQEVVVLLDIGATHNFLSLPLVEGLGLTIEGVREIGVMMGNRRFD
ncbi:hypothetical protein LXL04_003983 [Taraxacum kok-saghyz]